MEVGGDHVVTQRRTATSKLKRATPPKLAPSPPKPFGPDPGRGGPARVRQSRSRAVRHGWGLARTRWGLTFHARVIPVCQRPAQDDADAACRGAGMAQTYASETEPATLSARSKVNALKVKATHERPLSCPQLDPLSISVACRALVGTRCANNRGVHGKEWTAT